jgi:CheY-like chemotaxis protein
MTEQATGIVDKYKVLVVEDSEDFRMLVSLSLRAGGYDVAEAENGQEALDYLHHNPRPAIIVLDVRMPVMDAWGFRAEQERDAQLREIPVVVYSCEPNIALLARQLHAAGYVCKTEGPRRVLEEVRRCCH